jgi:hypothetical protein
MKKDDSTKVDKKEKQILPAVSLSWVLIIGFVSLGLIFFILILFTYYKHSGDISTSRDDWAAFGSVMSGASSFLAGMGTLGVILLGIKQFKAQQDQINAQTERQNKFEIEQNNIWNKENESRSFQMYLMHCDLFNQRLTNIENEFEVSFRDKTGLYTRQFPNNSLKESAFSAPARSWISSLNVYLINLHRQVKIYNKAPRCQAFLDIVMIIKAIKNDLNIDFLDTNQRAPKVKVLDIYIDEIQSIINIALMTSDQIGFFSDEKRQSFFDLKFDIHIFIQDIKLFSKKQPNASRSPVLDFFVLIQACINHDTDKHPDLYNIIERKYTSTDISLINMDYEKFRGHIIHSQLPPNEQDILASELDKLIQADLVRKMTN